MKFLPRRESAYTRHMGVTFSHGAYDGSYSGLDDFRSLVFRLAGYGDLNDVEGFTEPEDPDDPDGPARPGRNLRDVMKKSDGLYPLFEMEDTEGRLRLSALPPLAKQLRQLVKDHPSVMAEVYRGDPESGTAAGGPVYAPEVGKTWGELVNAFADGCERAHEARSDLTWE